MNWSRFTNPLGEPVDPERLAEIEDERGDHKRKIEAEDFDVTETTLENLLLNQHKEKR